MANVVTINRPDVVGLIEEAARKLTSGNATEAVALAMRHLLDQNARVGSLFGAHRGSVRVHEGVVLLAAVSTSSPTLRPAGKSSGDPADRLLVATAIENAWPLVTYDERIARFGNKHGQQYRFAVAA